MKYRSRMIADGKVLKQALVDFPNPKAAENEIYAGVLDPLLQSLSGKPIRWVELELAR